MLKNDDRGDQVARPTESSNELRNALARDGVSLGQVATRLRNWGRASHDVRTIFLGVWRNEYQATVIGCDVSSRRMIEVYREVKQLLGFADRADVLLLDADEAAARRHLVVAHYRVDVAA